MVPELLSEYKRLRAKDWPADQAMRAAKINLAFSKLEKAGLVRLNMEPEFIPWEDLFPCLTKAEAKRMAQVVEREGVWILISQYKDRAGCWEVGDSIGGILGNDWQDIGYDTDLKLAAMRELVQAYASTSFWLERASV